MTKYLSILLMLFLSLPASAVSAQQFRSETDEFFYRDYWPSGHLRSQEPLVNGQRHGLAEYYHDNGQLYGKIPWENGQKHGTFVLYLESGNVEEELSYKRGNLDGLNKWYYPDGTLYTAIHYKDGKMHGNGKWYNQQGGLTDEAEYADGTMTKKIYSAAASKKGSTAFKEAIGFVIYAVSIVFVTLITWIRKRKHAPPAQEKHAPHTIPQIEWLRKSPYETLTIIRGVMILGAFFLGAGAYYLTEKIIMKPVILKEQLLQYILGGAVVLIFVVVSKIREQVQKIAEKHFSAMPAGVQPQGILITTLTVVIFALGEALVTAGFVCSILTDNINYFFVLAAIGISLMMHMPDQESLARYQQGGTQ